MTETEHDGLSLRIATVDKWQGGEADVILFSLVIAPGAQQSARTFIQRERRRINVAISRARALCIVVGDLTYSRSCGIRHIEHLATRANESWSPPRPPYDSLWERRLDTAMRARGLKPFPQYPVGSRRSQRLSYGGRAVPVAKMAAISTLPKQSGSLRF